MTSLFRVRTQPFGPKAKAGKLLKYSMSFVGGVVINPYQLYETVISAPTVGLESCTDRVQITQPYEDHSLTLTKRYYKKYAYINGVYTFPWEPPLNGTQYTWKWTNYLPLSLRDHMLVDLPTMPATNWTVLRTQALAQLNVLEPVVDVPMFLWELKEFPKMLRGLGNLLHNLKQFEELGWKPAEFQGQISSVPGGYLAIQFGWQPIINDAMSLIHITGVINHKLNVLNDARRGKSTKGSLHTRRTFVRSVTKTVASGPNLLAIKVDREAWLDDKAWFTTRWEAHDKAGIDALLELYSRRDVEGIRLLLGLHQSNALRPSTLWEMIPWSWLIDYFANIGAYFEAVRGNLPMKPVDMCIMNEKRLTDTIVGNKFNDKAIKIDEGLHVRSEKLRSVYALPTPGLSYRGNLLGSQFRIITALVTARALRREGL